MRDIFRIGLIGAGQIGQVYLEVFRTVDELQLVAVADDRPQTLTSITEAYGVKGYETVNRMLREAEMDAVVICTPPSIHAEVALQCVGYGLHVLCEKPLALSHQDAERMISAAAARGVLLMMASKFRYVAEVIKAKGVIASGALGEVISFENTFCSHVDMRHRWNAMPRISGGGVIMDNGPHSADIARYLFGPIEHVFVALGRTVQEIEVEDTAHILIKSQSGVLGTINLGWSYNRYLDSFISIYGTSGTLHVGWKGLRYRLVDKPDWVEFGDGYNKVQAIRAQVINFIHSLQGLERPLITPDDALASVKVVEAAYRSLASNRWEEVN